MRRDKIPACAGMTGEGWDNAMAKCVCILTYRAGFVKITALTKRGFFMPAMNVSMTPELMHIVQSKVKSGLYNNASEFIREAVRQFDTNAELLYELKLAHLKAVLAEGMRQAKNGECRELTLQDVIKELNQH